ncbi:MAG TPA: shikimate dehydrogenase [Anaerolineales bacterium]
MIQLGLTGYPLGHSLSPAIHNAALHSCDLDGSYSLFPVRPDDKQGLNQLLQSVRSGEIRGLNVTIPHKQNVIEFLDELTPTAKIIGAVNTIYSRDGKLIGDNTDARGFITDLKRAFNFPSFRLPPSALILGAGGSARAVAYALANDGWNVYLTARRMEQAHELADSFTHYQLHITACNLSRIEAKLQSLISSLALIINTTPIGMAPNIDQSPWPEGLSLPGHAAVYDLVYNPRETKLVSDARRQGLPATTGLGMLVEQAALSFEIWTGRTPSRERMLSSIEQSPVFNL